MMEIDHAGNGQGGNEIFSKEAVKMHRVYKTLHEMVRDRGYSVIESRFNITLPEFCRLHVNADGELNRESLMFVVSHNHDESKRLVVDFPRDETVGVKPIRTLIERLAQNSVKDAIVVYRKNITASASKVLQTLATEYRIETFAESSLLVNITHHELVPKHIVMSDEDKKTLLNRYRLREIQLPRIQLDDPVARYYGLNRGQVVKIIRNSETAGRYVTYRLCW